MGAVDRRGFLRRVAGVGLAASAAVRGQAECINGGAVRWVVPHAVGGGFDRYSRLIEPYLEQRIGAAIRVDNVPGAGGIRGLNALSESRPDGRTIGIVNVPAYLIADLTEGFDFDPVEGLTLLASISRLGHVWVTSPEFNLRSLDDFLEAGRSQGLVFACSSHSSLGFLAPAIAGDAMGLKIQFVSGYTGTGEMIMALMRGEVDALSLSLGVATGRIQAGDLHPLLVTTSEAAEVDPIFEGLPQLFGESGLTSSLSKSAAADTEALVQLMRVGRVIAAPPGLDESLFRCMSEAVCETLSDPELIRASRERLSPIQAVCAAETLRNAQAARAAARV